MKPEIAVAIAFLPPNIHDYVVKISESYRIVCSTPFDRAKYDVDTYIDLFYLKLAEELKNIDVSRNRTRNDILSDINLIVLYLDTHTGIAQNMFTKFGVESLVMAIKFPQDACFDTPNRRRRAVNFLKKDIHNSVKHAETLFEVIGEHVRNKDNKTPLLLPPKNFGKGADSVFHGVRDAALDRTESEQLFRDRIQKISMSLDKQKYLKRNYFKGRSGILFKGQKKGGPRHGMAPVWGDADHKPSCVIRGRLRFGVPYDPKFHYDCDIANQGSRNFPSCHGVETVAANRAHVNISPNDNVR